MTVRVDRSDRGREETLGSKVESLISARFVPLVSVVLVKNGLGSNVVCGEGVTEEGDEVRGSLVLVLVVLVLLGGWRSRRGTRSVGPISRFRELAV